MGPFRYGIATAGDWVEDFAHEDGNYLNKCCTCEKAFLGHKRRIICKPCFRKLEDKFDSMTLEEQAAHLKEIAAIVKDKLTPPAP